MVIRIGMKNYTVIETYNSDELGKVFGKPYACAGICDTVNNQIHIAVDQSDFNKASTLVHEIIEALNHNYQLKLRHRQIEVLELGVMHFLVDHGINLDEILDKI